MKFVFAGGVTFEWYEIAYIVLGPLVVIATSAIIAYQLIRFRQPAAAFLKRNILISAAFIFFALFSMLVLIINWDELWLLVDPQ